MIEQSTDPCADKWDGFHETKDLFQYMVCTNKRVTAYVSCGKANTHHSFVFKRTKIYQNVQKLSKLEKNHGFPTFGLKLRATTIFGMINEYMVYDTSKVPLIKCHFIENVLT